MLPSNLEYKILITHLWQHVQCELGRDLLKPAYQNTVQGNVMKSLKGYVGRYIVLSLRQTVQLNFGYIMMEFHTVEGLRHKTLQPYVRGTVSSRKSHFMCKGRSIGFLSKINAEIRIQLETTIHCINVHLKQHATFPVKKSVREKMLQSIISTSVNLKRELSGRSEMVAVE